MNERILLHVFTDPGCPFAYSAEPTRLRLKWLYADQLDWRYSMIVLAETEADYERKGFTPEKQSKHFRKLRELHRMPIDDTQADHVAPTFNACLAFVAVRRNKPEVAEAFLRQLRLACMDGKLLDKPETIEAVARAVNLDIASLNDWVRQPEVTAELRAEMDEARRPTKAALALKHKLAAKPDGDYRYSAPSYQFIMNDKIAFELPGFWATPTYEAVIANLMPALIRHEDAANVGEVLLWAKEPLATAEVAAITGQDIDQVRAALQKVATMTPQGQDGFWNLK